MALLNRPWVHWLSRRRLTSQIADLLSPPNLGCPMLAESQRLDSGAGTLLNLALCHKGEGKLATAWGELNEALSMAKKDARKDREELARAEIEAIAPRLSHVTIAVPPASMAPYLVVSLDGIQLSPAAWGVPAAVDPGSHRVEADAPGRAHWTAIVLVDAEAQTRSVDIPPLPVLGPYGTFATAPARPKGPEKVASRSTARYAVGGVTLGLAAASIGTGIAALVEHAKASDDCDVSRGFCGSQSGIDAQSAARAWAWVSTATLGAAVVGAGVFLFWPKVTLPARVSVLPTNGGTEVVVGGRF